MVSFATLHQSHEIKDLHVAYVSSKKGQRTGSVWSQIGTAWFNKDGEGINLQLDALPVSGCVTLQKPKEKA
jgi:hypothetical protein